MALPAREQVKYWGIAAAVFLVVLWVLGDVILPFVLAGAFAYLLDPVADRFERMGLSRAAATTIITLIALLVLILAVLLVIPTLFRQAAAFVEFAPKLFQNLQSFLVERFPELSDNTSTIRQSLMRIGETIQSRGGEFLNGVLTTAFSLINIVVLIVLVPVITFYLLLDWDRMVEKVDSMLPRDHAPVVRRLAAEIDRTLAGFVRGQGTVCLVLGIYYAVALMVVGLQFGLVIGFTAGLLTFIPYVGALIGGALSIGVALFQFWGDWWMILIVAAIFQVGQMVEGNILTPKLVGSSVGLHPVWLIFALTAFGTLFGFVGMLVAVPVAAMLGVLTRFALEQYRSSLLYRGVEGRNGGDGGES